MTNSDTDRPLLVDLDGSLLKIHLLAFQIWASILPRDLVAIVFYLSRRNSNSHLHPQLRLLLK